MAALFLQPSFMLFGLMCSYTVFSVLTFLATVMFYVAAGQVLGGGWFLSNLIGMIAILAMFVLTLISCAIWSFSLITILPEKIFELCGGSMQTFIDSHSVAHDMAMAGSVRALQSTSSAINRIANELTGAGQSLQGGQGKNKRLGIESSSTA